MMESIRKFGLKHCDIDTMLGNVSVMLRALVLNIDRRNKKPIPVISYILALSVCLGYFYVYFVSMSWFVFIRCRATGDLLAAIIVFSLGASSEIGTVKLIYMFMHIDTVREIVADCLACDSSVVAGSRFSKNLLTTLRQVKKRAMVFWVVIISNGVVYVIKPVILPGRHFPEDKFILFVDKLMKKWRNVRDYYIKEKRKSAKSTVSGVKKKKYNYYNCLLFLDPIIRHKRRPRENSSGDEMMDEFLEDAQNDTVVSYNQYSACEKEEEENSNESSIDISQTIKQEKEEAVATKPIISFETHMMESSDRSQEEEAIKANKNFLLSLLPDVTSLDERQNMKFRLGVLNLLNDIKFELK